MSLVLTIAKRTLLCNPEDTGKRMLETAVIYGENSYFCLLQVSRLLELSLHRAQLNGSQAVS